MDTAQVALEVRDRLEITDAVYRFVAGIDFSDEDLFVSAFTQNAIVDVTSSNKLWGLDFPIFEGRNTIVEVFKNSVFPLDTTHAVTNPRIKINGRIINHLIINGIWFTGETSILMGQ